ncbi:biotin--[acetyl-CoA-carboxylase] ligase [Rhodococcus sp. NPDC047139]|uniref:biotin--[acetyl-CoA-carboxylase] ligase n=1 Tax=Rhodococcus sp. NPDC047139 TaxID=3155141 RepID=UPI003403A621
MASDRPTNDVFTLRTPLDEPALRSALVGADREGFYTRLDVVPETASTNADLLAVAATGDDRRVLLAEFQHGGRGRHSRSWNGVPGAQVIVSVLLRLPECPLQNLGWLPLLCGIATVDAVRSVSGVAAQLKWPNDVLVDGRKLAGILVEVAATAPVPTVVAGIGINVTLERDELPVPTATSLLLEGAAELDRTLLAQTLLAELGERIRAWARAGWDTSAAASAYRERCSTVGQHVRAILPGDTELHGIATDVDDQGRIVIRPDDGGDAVAVAAGDITHLRPA